MSIVESKFDILCVCLQGNRNWFSRASYDPHQHLASVYAESKNRFVNFIRRRVADFSTSFVVEPLHILEGKEPIVFIDVNARLSINVSDMLTDHLDSEIQILLDKILQGRYFDAQNETFISRWRQLFLFLAGVGVYAFVKLIINALGYYIP